MIPECPPVVGVRLASLASHFKEFLTTGHAFDVSAGEAIINDPEVQEYMKQLDEKALLPVPR